MSSEHNPKKYIEKSAIEFCDIFLQMLSPQPVPNMLCYHNLFIIYSRPKYIDATDTTQQYEAVGAGGPMGPDTHTHTHTQSVIIHTHYPSAGTPKKNSM